MNRHIKIISGTSGSGKTIALRALEDLGYYCVDNLPVVMLSQFAEEVLAKADSGIEHAAVSIDARNLTVLDSLPKHLKRIRGEGVSCEVIFLDTEELALVRRYTETRRTHPLMDDKIPLVESIHLEKQLLSPISEIATKHFDTTNMTPHELRLLIQEDAGSTEPGYPSLLFKSFAYKRGAPPDADFVFDVRCLPNPYWNAELKGYSGLDEPIVEFFADKPLVDTMINQIDSFVDEWMPRFHSVGRIYMTIAIGCTGGRHRSVYVVERLAAIYHGRRTSVQKRHGELR